MAYENFKDLHGRTAFDKVLHDKSFNIARNKKKTKKHGYQRDFASVDYNFFDKKYSSGAITSNHELDKELHKPIRKFEKQNVHSFVKDNNWGVIMQIYN